MMKINYIIAIPTYKRYNILINMTLKTILDSNINPKKIYIFVADSNEYNQYKSILPKNTYNKIIIGKLGIDKQRKFITNYFDEGTPVVFMDDDIQSIQILKGDKLIKLKNIDKFIQSAFNECINQGLYLWGIYPVNNPFFMKSRPEITNKLRFILGTLYGQIIRHSKDLITHAKEKEDIENSILHFIKDGGVIRYEKITIKTKFYNKNGGISTMFSDRSKVNEADAKYLQKKYPEYGKIWQRKNGVYEFRLKNFK